MTPIRVMIVDDHAVVRDGLQAVLSRHDDVEVVGTAADGLEAVHLARDCQPDVVLMDLGMPRMSGVEATRRLLAVHPSAAVIILTMSDDDSSLLAATSSGARGYLLKESRGDDVLDAIRAVAAGKAVFGDGVAGRVLGLLNTAQVRRKPGFPQLTPRELEILDLVASGATNPMIGRRLNISTKTVANILSSILVKIEASDRPHAIDKARAAGLGSPR